MTNTDVQIAGDASRVGRFALSGATRRRPPERARIAPSGTGGAYVRVKPAIEWAVALLVFAAAVPVFMVSSVLVKLGSPGPVLYSQIRLGRGGRHFRIYKLRTMTHDCEAATGPVWSLAGDPRVTRIGRWLRDTHLDELPQLWNVLRGDMSLVGPRPERPELAAHIERSMPGFRKRLAVRPGITGLAQVRLPADADLDTVRRKLSYDMHYIRNVGLALDARIVLSTALQLVGTAAASLSRQLVGKLAPADASSLDARPNRRIRRPELEDPTDLPLAA